jgi:hypothetical protein
MTVRETTAAAMYQVGPSRAIFRRLKASPIIPILALALIACQ